jgi:hypothetical protein
MFEAKELGIEDEKNVPEDVELEDMEKDKLQLLKSQLPDGKRCHCTVPRKTQNPATFVRHFFTYLDV